MRLTRLLLSTLAIAAATPAFAQDAPANASPTPPVTDASPTPPPADAAPTPPPPEALFTWSGAYVGVNGGYSWDARTRYNNAAGSVANNTAALTNGLRPSSHSIKDNGFLVGGTIGANFQVGQFDDEGHALVLGIEADGDYMDQNRTDTLSNTTNLGPLSTPSSTSYTRVNQYSSKMDYFGTARGRLGIASKSAMIYGTAGFAYAHVDRNVTYEGPNTSAAYFSGNSNGFKTGYVYGGGAEFALPVHSFVNSFIHASAVTLKAEFLRYHLGNDTVNVPGVGDGSTLGSYTTRVHDSGDIARVGLNYKF